MKKNILAVSFLCITMECLAQKIPNNIDIELKDLIVPSSPAFSILDFNPKTIERPGTIKALALNMVNETGKSGGIPKNFALEFAPYWFFKDAKMDIYNYNGIVLDDGGNFIRQNVFGLKN